MATYKEDTILALKNLGGAAHLSKIMNEVSKLREGNLNASWQDTVREVLYENTQDSKYGRGKYGSGENIFYSVEGKGKGVWGLRNYKNKLSLSDTIKKISNGWLEYRDHCKSTSKSGSSLRIVKQDHEIYDFVKTQWPLAASSHINLSKYKSFSIGSIWVTPIKYKTKLPAALPRPTPVGISFCLQKLITSQTNNK